TEVTARALPAPPFGPPGHFPRRRGQIVGGTEAVYELQTTNFPASQLQDASFLGGIPNGSSPSESPSPPTLSPWERGASGFAGPRHLPPTPLLRAGGGTEVDSLTASGANCQLLT